MPHNDCRVVTGYVRLDNGNRSHDSYAALGNRLLSLPVPITAFVDPLGTTAIRPGASVDVRGASLDDCWLWKIGRHAAVPPGNPVKDTLSYHAVQHEKTAWLAAVAADCPENMLAWVDFGILHVPGVTEGGIVGLVERVSARAPRDRVTVASIWGPPQPEQIETQSVQWWCAGGVLIVPRTMAGWLHRRVQQSAASLLASNGRLTWEVNVWAEVWSRHPERFRHYRCDHNASIVENGP
jgi:hypothetical protein